MIEFRQVMKHELVAVAEIFTNAFEAYPYLNLIIEPQKNKHIHFLMQKINVKAYFKKHKCFVGIENNQIITVALLKHRKKRSIGMFDFLLAGGANFILKAGLQRTKDILNLSEQSHLQCKHLGEDTWHLEALAVAPHSQGRNLGSRMLRECIIPYIEHHDGGILSLITNTEVNRKFYTKNGFEEFFEHTLHLNGKSLQNWSYKCIINAKSITSNIKHLSP